MFGNNKSSWFGVGLVASALLLGGCTTDHPDNFQNLEASEVKAEKIDALKQLIFPPAEAEEARKAFIQRCAAARGGRYEEGKLEQNLGLSIDGGLDTQTIKDKGYLPQVEPPVQTLGDGDEPGRAAYFGATKNGVIETTFMEYSSGRMAVDSCLAESYQYIYGSVEDGLKVALITPSFARAIADRVREDEAYTGLQEKWATCMEERGYPGLENVGSAGDLALTSGKDKAKKIAEADVACREANNYDSALEEIELSYYATVYQRLEEFSKEITAIHDTARANVEKDRTEPADRSPVSLPEPSPSLSSQPSPSQG